ncbi:hypothetical protein P3T23_008917 [Paraburkholderia sp. GAS448]|uniref:hypothetical protein n=1 Tax=Paraburkholderia sp. GAS448 TaxID=3035136 RepID=UPI003D22CBDD
MRVTSCANPHCMPSGAALCMALALMAISPCTHAQDCACAGNAVAGQAGAVASETGEEMASLDSMADASTTQADVVSASDIVLDDQVLSTQVGGSSSMLMVAATPELMKGGAVTLWDEIAPPLPLPAPAGVAQSAQGNVASYQRK